MAQNSWNTKERCGSLVSEEGEVVEEDDHEGKRKAFLKDNVLMRDPQEKPEPVRTRRSPPKQETRAAVRRTQAKTRNSPVPGPDRITCRRLKVLKDTRLGKAVLGDVGQMAGVENRYYCEEDWRGLVMLMIPKLTRDHTKLQGWRPIVLLNTIGKLAEKVVAERMMKEKILFHGRAFKGSMGRGAIDSVMLMDEIRGTVGGDVYGRDIKSAFNSLNRNKMREVLAGYGDLRDWVDYFLRPRSFEPKVAGKGIGEGTMVGETLQGSPLSPTLFTIYMVVMVWEAEKEMAATEEVKHQMNTRNGGHSRDIFIPLQYINDVNSVRVGKEGPMGREGGTDGRSLGKSSRKIQPQVGQGKRLEERDTLGSEPQC